MRELLIDLPRGALVLDLGCAGGSFQAEGDSFTVIRVDLEHHAPALANFVQADAARLPFRDRSFDVLISNHSLEHFDRLEDSLREIGRILKPSAALYIAVPDASTFSDRLYRWLARGGGHVNAFRSAPALAEQIEAATGLKHIATRTLCASLSCLNRKNRRTRGPRRLLLLGGGTQLSLLIFSYFSRKFDRIFRTRTSVYGWAFYFGKVDPSVDTRTWTNVCIRCGSGHPSGSLRVRRRFGFRTYRCPTCDSINVFTDDATQ